MSDSLRKAKLVEIAELNPRLSESLDSDELVSFIPMSAVTAESASTTTGEDRPYGDVSNGYTPFLNGDILLAKITPCFAMASRPSSRTLLAKYLAMWVANWLMGSSS